MSTEGRHKRLSVLALGALGVVFGDIGTSPLYALKECVSKEHGVPPSPENVLGILSLIFWALTLVVSIKYVTFVMRADNDGEGPRPGGRDRRRHEQRDEGEQPPHAVFAATRPRSSTSRSRILNFCTLPVTVSGNASTKRT